MSTILVVAAAAAVAAVIVSAIMVWASNRSALWNIAFALVLGVAASAATLLIAWLITRSAYPPRP